MPVLARALEPGAGHVLLSGYGPFTGTDWIESVVPLTDDAALEPIRLRVTHLSYDALFDTMEFVRVVDRMGQHGARVLQFTVAPRADVDFEAARASVRVHRYRAFGLRVGIDLPHRGEVANLFALSEQVLDSALERLAST